jgi:hypothetical protein
MINIYVLGCSTIPGIFVGGFHSLTSITAISVALVGFALLYRYRGSLKEKSPYAFYGLVVIVLLVGIVAVSISASPVTDECSDTSTGVSISQSTGELSITILPNDFLDSVKLVGPNGTRSTAMDSLSYGDRFTLRSNEEVINFLNNPKNNITVPTISGTKTVESVDELPFEYQEAPAGFVDPDAYIDNYDNASVATVACLHTSVEGFELGGEHIPAGSPIPCSTPFLAQKIDDRWTLGTYTKPTSGPNKDETLVSPVTLKKGEYQIIGTIDGQETVIQSLEVTDRTLRE